MEETLEYELLDIEWDLKYDFSQEMPLRQVKDGEEEPESPKEECIIQYDETGIPMGRRREEIKIREKLIKDFYAH